MIAERPEEVASSMNALGEAADQLGSHGARTLVLPIERIRCYEGNPRRGENPEFDRIKASVRAQGMDQSLVVTQRPGDTDYLLYAGGNTRLRILQELYTETKEQRFREVTCVYRSWTQEADVVLAHLRENDLRGELTFLDKALAVQAVRRLNEEQQDEACLTQARLVEILSDHGYALSQGLISQMTYVVERLLPLLPTALQSGMGRPQVNRIRQLERAARAFWLERAADAETEFDDTFAALCRRYDSPEWDIGTLRRALEAEIAERAEVSIHAVNMGLEGYLGGRLGVPPDESRFPTAEGGDRDDAPSAAKPAPESSAAKETEESSTTSTRVADVDDTTTNAQTDRAPKKTIPRSEFVSPKEKEDSALDDDNETLPEDDDARDAPADPGSRDLDSGRRPVDLKSLRARAWTLATRLAQRNGLSELVQPLSGKGLGFILRDVPEPALVNQLDDDTVAQVSMAWWHLAAAAELTVAPLEHLLPALDEASVLRSALEDQDAGLLFSSVWTLDPGHMGFRLWRRLDERSWRDLVDLMETYRALHQAAEASGEPLWP